MDFTSANTYFVDVFTGGTLLSYEQLYHPAAQLTTIGPGALRPASVPSMMCRVARNIINAVNRRPANGLELAWFAALSSLSILDPDRYLRGRICDFIRSSPSLCVTDIDVVEALCESEAIDGYGEHREFCQRVRQLDTEGVPPKRKSSTYSMVRFSIGQVFTHRLFQYDLVHSLLIFTGMSGLYMGTTTIALRMKSGKKTWYFN